MDEDIFGRNRKKKSTLSQSEALYKATLEALLDLDLSSHIYNPNLFKSYDPSLNTNQEIHKNDILKTSMHIRDKIIHIEADVGLGKPGSSKNLQSRQGKTPLKLGTSRKLSVSSTVLEKLGISLVKPVTSFGFEEIFVPSPFKRSKFKSLNARKRKKNRKKNPKTQAIKPPEPKEPVPDTSEDKKQICKKVIRIHKEHTVKDENIFKAKTKFINPHTTKSLVPSSNLFKEGQSSQKIVQKSIDCNETNPDIPKYDAKLSDNKTSKLSESNTGSSGITVVFLKAGEELHENTMQNIENNHEELKHKFEQPSIQVKEPFNSNTKKPFKNTKFANMGQAVFEDEEDITRARKSCLKKGEGKEVALSKIKAEASSIEEKKLQKSSTTCLEASGRKWSPAPNNEPHKSKSKNKKGKSTGLSATEAKQKTCEPMTPQEPTNIESNKYNTNLLVQF